MARRQKIENAEVVNVEPANPEVTPEVKVEATKVLCLVPGCGREGKIRGLCGRCCTSARMQIKKGRTSWEQLEKLGLAKPAKAGAFGGEKAVFVSALEKALAKKD